MPPRRPVGFVCPPDHPHGKSQACRHHGCTCDDCRTSHNARQRDMRRQNAYGRSSVVDAEPARAHIAELRARGMGVVVISRLSGLAVPTVGGVMWGREGRQPPKRIQRRTADAILGVQFHIDHLLPSANLDIEPYRRRLRALYAIGWTWKSLADELGMSFAQVSAIAVSAKRTKVEVVTARKVIALYSRLWDVRPTPRDATHASKIAISKRRAAAEGWAPPIAWDDIDDLSETPDGVLKDEPGWVVDELAHLYGLGESAEQVIAQIGGNPDSLAQLARRHHRPDIARWIDVKAA